MPAFRGVASFIRNSSNYETSSGAAFKFRGDRRAYRDYRYHRRSRAPAILEVNTGASDGGLLQDTSRLQRAAGVFPNSPTGRLYRARLCTGDKRRAYTETRVYVYTCVSRARRLYRYKNLLLRARKFRVC